MWLSGSPHSCRCVCVCECREGRERCTGKEKDQEQGGMWVVWSRGEERPYHRHFALIFAHCLPGPIIEIKACLVGNLAFITGRTSPGLCLEVHSQQ